MKTLNTVITGVLMAGLLACTPELPQSSQGGAAAGSAVALSQAEYDSLSGEQQYAVANKLMGTLFKGMPAKQFFDLDAGVNPLVPREGSGFLTDTRATLSKPDGNLGAALAAVETEYVFDEVRKPQESPLALLHELPMSREFFDRWMAYILANTILFSPALENESVDYTDIQDIYTKLYTAMDEGKSVRDIVYQHMVSQENWRRFRSPEDNVREMMEIYLGRFRDDEVPKAAIACKNWYLTDEDLGYQLIVDFNQNTEPQEVLDTTVVTCLDFYRALSQHPALIPRVTAVLVETFFPGYSAEARVQLINDIVATNPTQFAQIFSAIVFSREYLLKNERAKTFEETFMNVADRINWFAFDRFFTSVNNPDGGATFPNLRQMKQESMTYKLGRLGGAVPLDSLSFSYYHKIVRDRLFLDRKTDPFSDADGGWQTEFTTVNLSGNDFINYLFLSVVSRKATDQELATLNQVIAARRYETNKLGQTMIVLDYLSRLSELYAFTAIN